MRTAWMTICWAVLLLMPPAVAQDDKPVTSDHPDSVFLRQAANLQHLEIELSELASTRSGAREVRGLAQRVGDDQRKLRSALDLLAAHVKIKLAPALNELERQKVATLTAQSGEDFDKRYLGHIAATYDNTLMAFRTQSENARDPDTRLFARESLAKMQEHLKSAREILAESKANQTTKPATQPASTKPATPSPTTQPRTSPVATRPASP